MNSCNELIKDRRVYEIGHRLSSCFPVHFSEDSVDETREDHMLSKLAVRDPLGITDGQSTVIVLLNQCVST